VKVCTIIDEKMPKRIMCLLDGTLVELIYQARSLRFTSECIACGGLDACRLCYVQCDGTPYELTMYIYPNHNGITYKITVCMRCLDV